MSLLTFKDLSSDDKGFLRKLGISDNLGNEGAMRMGRYWVPNILPNGFPLMTNDLSQVMRIVKDKVENFKPAMDGLVDTSSAALKDPKVQSRLQWMVLTDQSKDAWAANSFLADNPLSADTDVASWVRAFDKSHYGQARDGGYGIQMPSGGEFGKATTLENLNEYRKFNGQTELQKGYNAIAAQAEKLADATPALEQNSGVFDSIKGMVDKNSAAYKSPEVQKRLGAMLQADPTEGKVASRNYMFHQGSINSKTDADTWVQRFDEGKMAQALNPNWGDPQQKWQELADANNYGYLNSYLNQSQSDKDRGLEWFKYTQMQPSSVGYSFSQKQNYEGDDQARRDKDLEIFRHNIDSANRDNIRYEDAFSEQFTDPNQDKLRNLRSSVLSADTPNKLKYLYEQGVISKEAYEKPAMLADFVRTYKDGNVSGMIGDLYSGDVSGNTAATLVDMLSDTSKLKAVDRSAPISNYEDLLKSNQVIHSGVRGKIHADDWYEVQRQDLIPGQAAPTPDGKWGAINRDSPWLSSVSSAFVRPGASLGAGYNPATQALYDTIYLKGSDLAQYTSARDASIASQVNDIAGDRAKHEADGALHRSIMGSIVSFAFPGLGAGIGSALGAGTGTFGSVVGNAIVGGATSAATGGDALKGALLAGAGAAFNSVGGLDGLFGSGVTGLPANQVAALGDVSGGAVTDIISGSNYDWLKTVGTNAAMGAGKALITGGDPLKGALTGAATGAVGGIINSTGIPGSVGNWIGETFGVSDPAIQSAINAGVSGSLTSGIGTAIGGGDFSSIVENMLIGGVASGAGNYVGGIVREQVDGLGGVLGYTNGAVTGANAISNAAAGATTGLINAAGHGRDLSNGALIGGAAGLANGATIDLGGSPTTAAGIGGLTGTVVANAVNQPATGSTGTTITGSSGSTGTTGTTSNGRRPFGSVTDDMFGFGSIVPTFKDLTKNRNVNYHARNFGG